MISSERAGLALLMAMILWASSFIALKWAFAVYPPMWVICGRMLVGCCCFLFFGRKLLNFSYRAGDWRLLCLISLCEPCIFFVLESNALMYTSASQAGMMTAMGPVLTALAALIFLHEKLSVMRWFGFFVAMSGVMIITFFSEADTHAPNPLLGNALELGAMICAAVYSIGFKLLCVRYSALTLTAMQAFVGSIFFAPLALMSDGKFVFDLGAVCAIFYLGTFVTAGAYLLYNTAISVIPITQAIAYVNLIPVFTVLLAYVLLNERLTLIQWIGSGVVLLGVWLTQRRTKKSPVSPDDISADPTMKNM